MTDDGAVAPLRFEILGELRALRGDDQIDLGPAKQRAVLAVLLLQPGRPVPIPRIVAAVWGDDPPENGANVVQKYVAGLRRVLGPDRGLLELTAGGYALRADALDADEFRAAITRARAEHQAGRLLESATTLRAGLARWRGEALAGLTGPVFDAARAGLTDERATAWENWAEIGLALGRAAAIRPELGRLIQEFPLREELRAQLMIALHQSGRQAEALAAFRDAREYFLDELGAEPGERMQEAHRRILRGEPAFSSPPAPMSMPPPPPPPMPLPISRPGTRMVLLEVLLAVLAPVATCGVGSWMYFVYAGVRRGQPKHLIAAGGYFAAFAVGVLLFVLTDPYVSDADLADPNFDIPISTGQNVSITMALIVPWVAIFHGLVLAIRSGDLARSRVLREQARQFAMFAPERAREVGIGRPELSTRLIDDGGLVDLNHVNGYELARATRLPVAQAVGIVADRQAHGPFTRPEDLVFRGLASGRTVHRLAPRLICIPASLSESRPR